MFDMRGNLVVKSSSDSNNNYSVMNRVMLRFRPIAPKPPGGENFSDAADLTKRNGSMKRTKRKYVRVRCRQTKRKNTPLPEKQAKEESLLPENSYVTLQLLPERSESEQICSVEKNQENNNNNNFQLTEVDELTAVDEGDYMELKSFRSVVETWIIVERVTETYNNNWYGIGLGFMDKERMSNLEADTCPGFVSDGTNKVIWVNEAYRRMVMVEEGSSCSGSGGVCVSLVMNVKLPYFCPSFACRVRLIQHTKHGQKLNKIVPCDVWRMDFQVFAWKLDVNTALSL